MAATYASDEETLLFVHQFEAVNESRIEEGMQRFKLLLESDLAGANH